MWSIVQVSSKPKMKLNYHNGYDRVRSMMNYHNRFDTVQCMTKTIQDNDMTDHIGVVYVEIEIELS